MTLYKFHGYRMLGVWDALVLVDESYEAHYVSLMHNFYTPLTLDAFRLLHGENQ
jgi:hypothetical protein